MGFSSIPSYQTRTPLGASPCHSVHTFEGFFLHQLLKYFVLNILSFVEPVYYDPTDYFDISQHEVDRQDELEYEVRVY